jgi:hypothetical protein
VRTPISGINLGAVALPKIDIKKVNEASRAKSQIRGASTLLEIQKKQNMLNESI